MDAGVVDQDVDRADLGFDLSWYVHLVIVSVLYAVVVPPVPGGMIACLSLLLAELGLPGSMLALLTAVVVAAIAFGVYTYTQNTAYLAAHDGKVAVYQGVPDTVFGIELSHLDHVTEVEISKLQPGVAKRLSEGVIRVDNLEAAEELVNEYRSTIAKDTP